MPSEELEANRRSNHEMPNTGMDDSFESRRYFCQYCGISRSKKTLITSHINSHHQVEMEKAGLERDQEAQGTKLNTCRECGASFKKPAYLLQHMQSHSLEESIFYDIKIIKLWKL